MSTLQKALKDAVEYREMILATSAVALRVSEDGFKAMIEQAGEAVYAAARAVEVDALNAGYPTQDFKPGEMRGINVIESLAQRDANQSGKRQRLTVGDEVTIFTPERKAHPVAALGPPGLSRSDM